MTALLLLACVDPDPGDTRVAGAESGDSAAADTADTADTAPPDTAVDTAPPAAPPPCDAWAAPRDVGTLADADRDEVSGVAPSVANPGVLWVHEDHGGDPAFYAVDYTGAALGTLTLDGATNEDWEAMALGACGDGDCLWVADVGDNAFERDDYALYRVPEPRVGWAGGLDATAVPERFPIAYAEGRRNVEAMFLTPDGRPVLLTKRGDGLSEVFVVDTLVPDEVATPRLVGTIATREEGVDSGGFVTSADLWVDGTRVLVRTYERAWELDLGDAGLDGIVGAAPIEVPFPDVARVEAVAYDATLRGFWQIPEGINATIAFTACSD